jgi:hypothetical protein
MGLSSMCLHVFALQKANFHIRYTSHSGHKGFQVQATSVNGSKVSLGLGNA